MEQETESEDDEWKPGYDPNEPSADYLTLLPMKHREKVVKKLQKEDKKTAERHGNIVEKFGEREREGGQLKGINEEVTDDTGSESNDRDVDPEYNYDDWDYGMDEEEASLDEIFSSN